VPLVAALSTFVICAARVPISWESDVPELRGEEGLPRYKYRIKSTGSHLPAAVGPKSFGDGFISCISPLHGIPAIGVKPQIILHFSTNGCGER
jgi:hypothetical protein